MADSDIELWRSTMDTNVIGPMQVARHLMSSMRQSGIMAFMSSESVGLPYHGMVPYSSSKAALEEAVRGLRVEYPQVRVTCIPVGATAGTDITRELDPDVIATLYPMWVETGRLAAASMDARQVGDVVTRALAASLPYPGLSVENLVIRAALGTPPGDVAEVLAQIDAQGGESAG